MLFSLSLIYIQIGVYTQLPRSWEKVLSADMLRQIEYPDKMHLYLINPLHAVVILLCWDSPVTVND